MYDKITYLFHPQTATASPNLNMDVIAYPCLKHASKLAPKTQLESKQKIKGWIIWKNGNCSEMHFVIKGFEN